MESGFFTVDSIDDIVFEGRNKAYGAYVLRQEYPLQVVKATSISLVLIFTFIIFLVTWGQPLQPPADNAPIELKERPHTLISEPILPKQQINPMVPEPGTTSPKVATKAFRSIKIVSVLAPVTAVIPDQHSFDNAEPDLITTAGDLPGTVAPDITGEAGNVIGYETENKIPFEVVEKMPQFPEGLTAMYKFINKHLRYPAKAQSQGLEGNVILTFVVSASGEIGEIKILQDIGGGAGEEAKRVVSLMPRWQPGLQHNRAVPVRFTLPIRFRIN